MDSASKGPSPGVGRSNIDAFLATLSPWDLLYLRGKFRSGIPITGLAGLPDLPAEIISLIVIQLTLDDIVNCRLVSRDWYSSWTQGAVITALSHFFFPGLIEKHKQLSNPQSLHRLVQASVARALRRQARPSRISFITWRERHCPVFRRPGEEAEAPLDCHRLSYEFPGPGASYDRARLAWQADQLKVVVDDLRTCERHDCSLTEMYLQGQELTLQGMSRELLVFFAQRVDAVPNYNTMQIWHTDLKDWRRVTLPGPFARCFVEGERVAFFTRQDLLVAWSWRGGASEIDISGEMNQPPEDSEGRRSIPGVILHPEKPDTLYVASIFRSKLNPGGTRQSQKLRFLMSVVRYEGGKPTKRWQELIQEDSLSNHFFDSLHDSFRAVLLCPKMGPNGLYNLGTVLTASDVSYDDARVGDLDPARVVELATTAFSIYKESFIQRRFVESAGDAMIYRLPMQYEPSLYGLYGLCKHEEQLTTWSEEHASIPRWVLLDSDCEGRPDPDNAAKNDIISYLRELNKCESLYGPCVIMGDEDFQIHVTSKGILVWSFTEGTRLPAMDGPESLRGAKNEPSTLVYPVRPTYLLPVAD
ncbi:Cyclin-like F-box [Metarhizium guizhouense ARSEF 977]|uniref:Cyclin-like F-box n=1 Tax=Metarhizium guizhouense (strain ARSEF 977) TaxID=1276136 RepID=A0A0B4GE76_METGA|nr:Cyclin-like F-box [Metarhizium guizhouense ARSEF 977]